jgi:hypothetical protein
MSGRRLVLRDDCREGSRCRGTRPPDNPELIGVEQRLVDDGGPDPHLLGSLHDVAAGLIVLPALALERQNMVPSDNDDVRNAA